MSRSSCTRSDAFGALRGKTARRSNAVEKRNGKNLAILSAAANRAVDNLVLCEPLETRVLLSVPGATWISATVNSSNYVNLSWTSPTGATNVPLFQPYGRDYNSTGPDYGVGWNDGVPHTNTSATNVGSGVGIVSGDFYVRIQTYVEDPDTSTWGYTYSDTISITVPPHFAMDNLAAGPDPDHPSAFSATAGTVFVDQELANSEWEPGYPLSSEPMTGVIDWGDGKTSDATFDDSGTDALAVKGTHTYAKPGAYTYSFTVYHNGTSSIFSDTAWVVPAPIVPATPQCNANQTRQAAPIHRHKWNLPQPQMTFAWLTAL